MLRSRAPLVASIVFSAMFLTASCASKRTDAEHKEGEKAKEQEIDVREVAPESKIRLLDALHAALAARPGEAIEAELEGEIENGKREVAFEVAIVDEHGVAWSVAVDPATGKVASVAKEDEADEIKEIAEKRDAAGASHLKLGGLLERAMKRAPGATPVKISFSGAKAPGKARAKLLRGDKDVKVTLDAKTGEIIETSEEAAPTNS